MYNMSSPIPATTHTAALKDTDRTETMTDIAPSFMSSAPNTIANIQNILISFLETKIAPKGIGELLWFLCTDRRHQFFQLISHILWNPRFIRYEQTGATCIVGSPENEVAAIL
jgi:hypothetical protein